MESFTWEDEVQAIAQIFMKASDSPTDSIIRNSPEREGHSLEKEQSSLRIRLYKLSRKGDQ